MSRKIILEIRFKKHLNQKRWMRRLCLFHKVFHNKVPQYIHSFIPSFKASARQTNTFTSFYCRTEYLFIVKLILNVISEWNKIDTDVRSYQCYKSFKLLC